MSSIARTIEIILLPHGDAPEWVRAAWIGCVLPTAGLECGHVPQYVESVLPSTRKGLISAAEYLALPGSERGWQKIAGYSVFQTDALKVLKEHNPAAAKWWSDMGFPKVSPERNCFRFKNTEVKVISTYTEAELRKMGPITVYDDMETGTMRSTS